MNLAFDRPFLVFIAFLIVPLLIIFSRYLKPLFTLILPLGPPGGIPFKAPVNLNLIIKALQALELIGVVFLFIAAAGPHFSNIRILWLNRGADILFVVDVSPSMAALDMNTRSRFDTARDLVRDFALRRSSDSLGLTAVGEDAALLVPLTTDREVFFSRLANLSLGELGDGTALGMGLSIAALHIAKSTAPRRAVVLITDGENNAGSIHPETAAAFLGDLGVSLWVIGVGTTGEVPIDYLDPVTRIRRTGTFDSRYDPQTLIDIADKAKGTWIAAASADAFASAFAQIDQTEMIVHRSTQIKYKEPFHIFFILSGSILILIVHFIRLDLLGAFL
jgi:Ca-activated chloride channel family protein